MDVPPPHCGTGAEGALPIVPDALAEARRRGVELVAVPTDEACALLADTDPATTNAILRSRHLLMAPALTSAGRP